MKERNKEPRTCPKCGRVYTERPASSRVDGSPICPDCGTREALESIGVGREEQDKILGIIHEKYQPE
jgi:predicted nucleic-acid-binding Zn-ribbon protein